MFKMKTSYGVHILFYGGFKAIAQKEVLAMTTEKEIKIIEDSVRIIREKTDFEPEIGMILGSGLGDYADKI